MNQEDARRLAKELEGVIVDVEEGDGFDEVCLSTLKYVRDALVLAQPEQSQVEETLRYEIDALEAKLAEYRAQPAQEPVAWMDGYRNIYSLEEKAAGCEDAVIPLVPATLQHWSDCSVHNEPAYPAGKCDCGGYTTPPHRKPLTDEEIHEVRNGFGYQPVGLVAFARAIEAKHGIKE